jgi:hypothetical protein
MTISRKKRSANESLADLNDPISGATPSAQLITTAANSRAAGTAIVYDSEMRMFEVHIPIASIPASGAIPTATAIQDSPEKTTKLIWLVSFSFAAICQKDRQRDYTTEKERNDRDRKRELVESQHVDVHEVRKLNEQPGASPVIWHVVEAVDASAGDVVRAQHVAGRGKIESVVMNLAVCDEVFEKERVLVDPPPDDAGSPHAERCGSHYRPTVRTIPLCATHRTRVIAYAMTPIDAKTMNGLKPMTGTSLPMRPVTPNPLNHRKAYELAQDSALSRDDVRTIIVRKITGSVIRKRDNATLLKTGPAGLSKPIAERDRRRR